MVDRMAASTLIRDVRSGVRNKNDLRIVFDLSERVTPRSFLLGPSAKLGNRLVLDLHEGVQHAVPVIKRGMRDVIVAIDAGHGVGILVQPAAMVPTKNLLHCKLPEDWKEPLMHNMA